MSDKSKLRPKLNLPALSGSTLDENFQNETLRPILKLQNEIYLTLFTDYALRQHKDFQASTPEQKRNFVTESFQKDHVLKNMFIGITIGMLTAKELETYLLNSKNHHKRITNMIVERILKQL